MSDIAVVRLKTFTGELMRRIIILFLLLFLLIPICFSNAATAATTLSVDRLTSWYWTDDTQITSMALGDVDGDGQIEVVTAGHFFDGT